MIFQNADAAGLGIFQAVKEAKGIWIIGSNANQNDIAPDQTLGSVVIDLPHAFLFIAREVQRGNFSGHVFSLGLHDDVVMYVANPKTAGSVPAPVATAVDSIGTLMKSGSFAGKILPDSMQEKVTR